MATFGEVLQAIQDEDIARQRKSASDVIRRNLIKALHDLTGRNVVVYYSSWLQRQGPEFYFINQINDEDKHGIMATFAGLDFGRGLDLILHTPGGDVAATESIIDYLRSKFGSNIRAIVPQISMSGGTMIALAGKEIIMGTHSNLGPIDPQIGNRPAIAILKEFERARAEILADPNSALLWQPILQQYFPTMLSHAQQSIDWATQIGKKTLETGMFHGQQDATAKADAVVNYLISHDVHKAHGRHLHRTELKNQGLVIVDLENDAALQNAVLSVHHACMLTVGNQNVGKLIENHLGITYAKIVQQIVQRAPVQPMPQPQPQPGPAQQVQPRLTFFQRLKIALQLIFYRTP
jgi:hypothetical protein